VTPSPSPAGRPWYERPAKVASRTCAWICVVTGGVTLAGMLLYAAVATGLESFRSSSPLLLLIWMIVAALTWVVGWPAGWLAEHLLDRAGARPALRVFALAGLGAVLAALITAGFGLSAVQLVFVALGAGSTAVARWIVVVRSRRFAPTVPAGSGDEPAGTGEDLG
jgi:hypothetical protein